jgi:protein NrfC
MAEEKATEAKGIGRREFLKGLGAGIVGGGLVVAGVFTATKTGIVSEVGTKVKKLSVSASEGYILVDTQKCASCQTCMLACSLVHEGVSNPSLSRIQIMHNTFGNFPNDITMAQCRQCVYPACVYACPTGALSIDSNTGVRTVNEDACIGCQRCIQACPFTPARVTWDFTDQHAEKCDLCQNAKYWSETGGPGGKQACVENCPMKAIKFSNAVPMQAGAAGYDVNLRTANWANIVPNVTASIATTPTTGTYFNYTPPPTTTPPATTAPPTTTAAPTTTTPPKTT